MRQPFSRVFVTGTNVVLLSSLLMGCAVSEGARAGRARDPMGSPAAPAGVARPPAPEPVSQAEFAARRAALARELEDGVFVALGTPTPSHDYLPWAQSSSFRYLTGILEPDAALVMVKEGGRVDELLFVQPRDPAREVWEGRRLGPEGAAALTGIRALPRPELAAVLDSILGGAAAAPVGSTDGGVGRGEASERSDASGAADGSAGRPIRLYTLVPVPPGPRPLQPLSPEQQFLARIVADRPWLEVVPVGRKVLELRGEKSDAERSLIRAAVHITALAHRQAMAAIEPGMNEFELQALIEYTFRRNGAERPAFASIVGSGPNATTLHYNANDRYMGADDVVVIDIGASYGGYAADVTRTLPVRGRFSAEQRAIYEIVLAAQKAAEARVRPGVTWAELHEAANTVLADGLARLGLIDSPDATYVCSAAGRRCPQFRLFYMHGLGHGVGLDVHDPDGARNGALPVGSAFTIEPGLYIRADALDYLPDTEENRELRRRLGPAVRRYRDIGVRIEDVYFVTATGYERISAGVPREIDEIEALLAGPRLTRADRDPVVVEWYRTIGAGDPR